MEEFINHAPSSQRQFLGIVIYCTDSVRVCQPHSLPVLAYFLVEVINHNSVRGNEGDSTKAANRSYSHLQSKAIKMRIYHN